MTRIISPRVTMFFQVCCLMGTSALLLNTSVINAATNCYDFSKPAVGTQYHDGQTIPTQHGVVNVLKLVDEDGNATPPNDLGAEIHNSVPIPEQSENPSLLNHGNLTIQVVPENRKSSVTFKFAENTGIADNQMWNFGVNGKRKVWRGQMSALDGQYLGSQQNGGRVRIAVNATPDGPQPDGSPSYWVRGTVTLTSDPVNPKLANRGISKISFGRSSQLKVDDVCMTD